MPVHFFFPSLPCRRKCHQGLSRSMIAEKSKKRYKGDEEKGGKLSFAARDWKEIVARFKTSDGERRKT